MFEQNSFEPNFSVEWKAWQRQVSVGAEEDMSQVFNRVRLQATVATRMKWARDRRTHTFCDLALHVLYQNHIQRVSDSATDGATLFTGLKAASLVRAAEEIVLNDPDCLWLTADRFNDTWGNQYAFSSDLIAYLFRPGPYTRRLAEFHPQLVAMAPELTLGQWLRRLSSLEMDWVRTSPLVSLHTYVETLLPRDTHVADAVRRLRAIRLQRWADLYEQVFTAYGAPLREDKDQDLDWLSVAERFSTIAGGAVLRTGTETGSVPEEMLARMLIEILPALLTIDPAEVDTRRLQ